MLLTEYNEEEQKKLFWWDGYREGIIGAVNILRSMGFDDSVIVDKIKPIYKLTDQEAETFVCSKDCE